MVVELASNGSRDSSRRRAPAAADTAIDDASLSHGLLGRRQWQSQCPARIEFAPSWRRAPRRARSYAGATQHPWAERIGGRQRAAPSAAPLHAPGPCGPGSTYLAQGPLTRCHRRSRRSDKQRRDDHVPSGSGPRLHIPPPPSPLPNEGRGRRRLHILPRPDEGRGSRGRSVPPSFPGRSDRRGHGARCKAIPARGAGSGLQGQGDRVRARPDAE
jgi:hypothetical protein